jgi:hypothetical protein
MWRFIATRALRGSWISCDRHGSWLISVLRNLGRRFCDLTEVANPGVPAEWLDEIIGVEREWEKTSGWRWISDTASCLKSVEAALIDATSGRPPPQEKWGPVGADEFLAIVHDISTWALENFENYSTRCAAELFYLDYAPALPPIFYLSPMPMSPRGTHRPERSLQRCIDPAERRNALWLVHALLAAEHPTSTAVDFGTSRSDSERGQLGDDQASTGHDRRSLFVVKRYNFVEAGAVRPELVCRMSGVFIAKGNPAYDAAFLR